MYVLPSTCYSKRNINNIPKSIALKLRRICDSDEKLDKCSDEYQNYLIARDYNISLVKKQFHSVRSISRSEARQVKHKVTKESFNLVTVYNPLLNNLQKVIKNNLPLLYSDPDMRAEYLIYCRLCKDQYVGSAYKNNFKPRFRVHKSDINTGKDRCGVAKHFLTKCTDVGKLENSEVHLIEQVKEGGYDVEGKLWCREKYWQAQLFTLSHGMGLG